MSLWPPIRVISMTSRHQVWSRLGLYGIVSWCLGWSLEAPDSYIGIRVWNHLAVELPIYLCQRVRHSQVATSNVLFAEPLPYGLLLSDQLLIDLLLSCLLPHTSHRNATTSYQSATTSHRVATSSCILLTDLLLSHTDLLALGFVSTQSCKSLTHQSSHLSALNNFCEFNNESLGALTSM